MEIPSKRTRDESTENEVEFQDELDKFLVESDLSELETQGRGELKLSRKKFQ